MTPMLSQYTNIKKQYPDAIVFYRMGDFYEMFFEDAVKAAPVLDVQLTSRDRNAENPIPMCGVPFHAAQNYIQKLVDAGFKVALCEQLEDPSTTKGLVKRDVVRVITPALLGEPELATEDQKPVLVALQCVDEAWHVASLNLLDSELKNGILETPEQLYEWLKEVRPREWLLPHPMEENEVLIQSRKLFSEVTTSIREKYFHKGPLEAVHLYLKETQKLDLLGLLSHPQPLRQSGTLLLDTTTVRSLDLVPFSKEKAGPTLLSLLDRCSTAMGKRLLKQTLLYPSTELPQILSRHDAVEELYESSDLLEELTIRLKGLRDLERLTGKVTLQLALPRDLGAIRDVQKQVPDFKARLLRCKSKLLKSLGKKLLPLEKLTEELISALQDPAPGTYRDGNIFLPSYRAEIGELRGIATDAKGAVAAMETRERDRTGISSLKIKYSRVFGYTIEITKTHLTKVPSDYIRKQTIANGERYITPALKEFEERVVFAEQKLKALEEQEFLKLRALVEALNAELLSNARALAELDLLCGFAVVSRECGFSKPQMREGKDLRILEGRHPVVESVLGPGRFVANDMEFSESAGWTWILTGPNMGGKSTVMRQVALICILAQSGCFVPAKKAFLPVLDAVFTRIGSQDELAEGRSTFMVEMSEMARILNRATNRSLILIDEIGRGTSTYDGLSLAWSLLEYTHTQVQAKTLFATHFHEITSLSNRLPGLMNYHVQVEKWKDSVVFLYKIAPGVCHRSYGIDVAVLAGVPNPVITRAREIQGLLEAQSQRAGKVRTRAMEIHDAQLGFF